MCYTFRFLFYIPLGRSQPERYHNLQTITSNYLNSCLCVCVHVCVYVWECVLNPTLTMLIHLLDWIGRLRGLTGAIQVDWINTELVLFPIFQIENRVARGMQFDCCVDSLPTVSACYRLWKSREGQMKGTAYKKRLSTKIFFYNVKKHITVVEILCHLTDVLFSLL